jgi:hypothetical protein
MQRHDWAADAELILRLADGQLPDGVRPGTPEGEHYRRIIEAVEADIAAAPPVTDAEVAAIIPILRRAGGGHASAA